jgi:hypothetical protein
MQIKVYIIICIINKLHILCTKCHVACLHSDRIWVDLFRILRTLILIVCPLFCMTKVLQYWKFL